MVLEQFTDEQIAQIKKELKERERQSQKQAVVGDQIKRIETLFPRSIYCSDGNGLFATGEIKDALLMLCDHITNNYVVKTKRTVRHSGKHLVRAGLIPGEIEERYRSAFVDLVDVIEKWNIPLPAPEPKHEEQKPVTRTETMFAPDPSDSRHLVKLKPGVKPCRD